MTMYLKVGSGWVTIDITGSPVLQVRSGEILFSDELTPPKSDKNALYIKNHEVKICNRKVIHIKTAKNNVQESEVFISAMFKEDEGD